MLPGKGFEVFPECRRQEPNRAGKVLEHYKDSGPKYDAACFLIKNMPGYYSYAKSSGLDSLRKIQSVIFHKNIFLVICKTNGVSSPTRARPRCMTATL